MSQLGRHSCVGEGAVVLAVVTQARLGPFAADPEEAPIPAGQFQFAALFTPPPRPASRPRDHRNS